MRGYLLLCECTSLKRFAFGARRGVGVGTRRHSSDKQRDNQSILNMSFFPLALVFFGVVHPN